MQRRGATSEIHEVANASLFSSAPRTGAHRDIRFRLRGLSGATGRRLVLLPSLSVLKGIDNPSGANASEGKFATTTRLTPGRSGRPGVIYRRQSSVPIPKFVPSEKEDLTQRALRLRRGRGPHRTRSSCRLVMGFVPSQSNQMEGICFACATGELVR